LVRKAVGDSGRTQAIIQTLHGHGYRFVAPVDQPSLADETSEAARSMDVDAPSKHAEILTSYMDKDDPDSSLGPGTNRHGADSREVRSLEERCSGLLAGGWRWWLPRLGLALALITVGVLAGWAISSVSGAHSTGGLDKSRIAVLPFVDLSAEPDHNYVADGLTEDLIAELARTPGLTVVARTSVLKYKDSLKDVTTIGHELRVGTIVEGSVRRIDNQVRISAQLIDVASQGHMWSQEYDRELSEILGIQRDMAGRVAQWLKGQVTAAKVTDCLRTEPHAEPHIEPQSTTLVQRSGASN
jgi:TolB-like protein